MVIPARQPDLLSNRFLISVPSLNWKAGLLSGMTVTFSIVTIQMCSSNSTRAFSRNSISRMKHSGASFLFCFSLFRSSSSENSSVVIRCLFMYPLCRSLNSVRRHLVFEPQTLEAYKPPHWPQMIFVENGLWQLTGRSGFFRRSISMCTKETKKHRLKRCLICLKAKKPSFTGLLIVSIFES